MRNYELWKQEIVVLRGKNTSFIFAVLS